MADEYEKGQQTLDNRKITVSKEVNAIPEMNNTLSPETEIK